MKHLKYVENLEFGDTLFLSEGNKLYIVLFAGYGSGTIQYYMPSSLVSMFDAAGGKFDRKKIWKGYIMPNAKRVAKVDNPIIIDKEEREEYEKAKFIMEQHKLGKL